MPLKDALKVIQDTYQADAILFNDTINENTADSLFNELEEISTKSANCILILTTNGGYPDPGYKIMRYLKRIYTKIILYSFGPCKSTGTLMALGADEIVMSDFGEFGPLDVQMTKDDELIPTSGLSYVQSLFALNEQMYDSFEDAFLSLKQRSGFTISTKTAAEIASKLAIGLVSPISAQLDPLRIGEVNRAIRIAEAYGKRLCGEKSDHVAKLIGNYPSHSFVIDFEEAKKLFPNVRVANENELEVEKHLSSHFRMAKSGVILAVPLVPEATHSDDADDADDATSSEQTPDNQSLETNQDSNLEANEKDSDIGAQDQNEPSN